MGLVCTIWDCCSVACNSSIDTRALQAGAIWDHVINSSQKSYLNRTSDVPKSASVLDITQLRQTSHVNEHYPRATVSFKRRVRTVGLWPLLFLFKAHTFAQVAWFTKLQGSKGWELRSSKNRKNNEKGLKSVTLGTSVLDIRSFKIQYPRRIRFRICNSKSDSLGPTKNDSSANNSKTA